MTVGRVSTWFRAAAMTCLGVAVAHGQEPAGVPKPGTVRMAERLARIARESDPQKNMFLNARRVAALRSLLDAAASLSVSDRVRLEMTLGYELVLKGDSAAAAEILEGVQRELEAPNVRPSAKTLNSLSELLAITYLRLGEQENCIAHHSQDSCLMPIRGSGVHTLPQGSQKAMDQLARQLESDPNNLKARWLYNLAAMTLGKYPDQVPESYLIPPKVFESEYEIPRFYDVAAQVGLARVGLSGGCVTEDFDRDGYIDVMESSWGLTDQLRYHHNSQDGTFEDRTEAAGLIGEVGGLNLCHTDYNNDGYADVLVLRGAWLRDQGRIPNSLLRNNGDGTFEDVTDAAGLLSFHPTQAGAWGDFDNDGWVDLFIGNESGGDEIHPCELYHNNGDGTFTNVAEQAGVAHLAFVKGATWGDYDNDGWQDLYLSCLGSPNVLYHNEGRLGTPGQPAGQPGGGVRFVDVTAQAGVGGTKCHFAAWFWDYDNDGWLDLFAASFLGPASDSMPDVVADYLGQPNDGVRPKLYRNKRDGTFEDVTIAAGMNHVLVAMGANFGDLDNDGYLDCYLGTGDPLLTTLIPNRMFRNAEGKFFPDVTTSGGFGHLQKGHGVSFVDLDNDGDQDVYAVMGGAFEGDVFQNSLFENPGFGNHWITLRLEGTTSNRPAIGARIKVTVATEGGSRDIHATVSTGGSFGSDSLQQEIGLGKATRIERLEIHWPTSKKTQRFEDVPLDRFVRIREDADVLETVSLRHLDLSPKDGEAPCPLHAE